MKHSFYSGDYCYTVSSNILTGLNVKATYVSPSLKVWIRRIKNEAFRTSLWDSFKQVNVRENKIINIKTLQAGGG